MGTRCMYGFRKNGVEKTTYRHSDGYLKGAGQEIIEFIEAIGNIEKMNVVFEQIIMVKEDDLITKKQAALMNKELNKAETMVTVYETQNGIWDAYHRRNSKICSGESFYNQFQQFKGNFNIYFESNFPFMLDIENDEGFYYIIDLDTNELHIRGDISKGDDYEDVDTKIKLQTIIDKPGLDLEDFLHSNDTHELSIKKTKIKNIFRIR